MASKLSVYNSPFSNQKPWKPAIVRRATTSVRRPAIATRRHQTLPTRTRPHKTMTYYDNMKVRPDGYLRYLAEQLLNRQECARFKQALHDYRASKSLPRLFQDLREIVDSVEKIVILVEVENHLPKDLRDDFTKLCTVYYDNYTEVSNAVHGGISKLERSKVIAQDATGTLKVLAKDNQKSLIVNHKSDNYLFNTSNSNSSETCVIQHSNDKTDAGKREVQTATLRSNYLPDESGAKISYRKWISMQADNNNNVSTKISPNSSSASGKLVAATDHLTSPPYASTATGRKKELIRYVNLQRISDVSFGLTIRSGPDGTTPVEIMSVDPQSQAKAADLRVGDVILEVNGHDLREMTDEDALALINSRNLHMKILASYEDDEVIFKTIEKDIKIRVNSDGVFGFCLAGGADVRSPAVVSQVFEGSVAELAGLRKNDHVISILGAETDGLTHRQIVNLAMSAKVVKIRVQRRVQIAGKKQPSFDREFPRNGIEAINQRNAKQGPQSSSSPVITRRSFEMYAGRNKDTTTKGQRGSQNDSKKYQFDPAVYSSVRSNRQRGNESISISETNDEGSASLKTNNDGRQPRSAVSDMGDNHGVVTANLSSDINEYNDGKAVIYVDNISDEHNNRINNFQDQKAISGNLNTKFDISSEIESNAHRGQKKPLDDKKTINSDSSRNEKLDYIYEKTEYILSNEGQLKHSNQRGYGTRSEVQAAIMRGMEKRAKAMKRVMENGTINSINGKWMI